MKLYYKPGACSLAAHIILYELETSHELERVDTISGRTETGADYRQINPKGYVGALALETGEIITENPAILQYLGDLSPERALVPVAGSLDRVRLQELLSFLASELHKSYSPYFSGAGSNSAALDGAARGVSTRLAHIEKILSDGRPYLMGATYTVADAYCFVIASWSAFVEFDLSSFPGVEAFVARVRERPATVAAMKAEGLLAA